MWQENHAVCDTLGCRCDYLFFVIFITSDDICDQLLNRCTATWNLNNNGASLITLHVEKLIAMMIAFKLKAKNCSRGQLFRLIWLSL